MTTELTEVLDSGSTQNDDSDIDDSGNVIVAKEEEADASDAKGKEDVVFHGFRLGF